MTTETPAAPAAEHLVVPHEQWLQARRELLGREKQLRREMDEIAALRRGLPWERVEKDYVFDSAQGERRLAELFGGKSQLLIYHFMLGPGWAEGCRGCSFVADHIDGTRIHLAHRDVNLVAVSHAPLAEIEAFERRMGWKFPWFSSFRSSFNFDYKVSFTDEQIARGDADYNYANKGFPSTEAPGLSAFYKDQSGAVFHTYSTYARGLDVLLGTYNFLDMAPKGRDEDGLETPMAWLRHHDRYEDSPAASHCECEK